MQEDMRLKLPAAVPENRDERVEVRVTIGMDTQGDGEASYVAFWPEPGVPLVIRPEDWLPKATQPAPTLRERLTAVIDERRASQGDFPHQPIAPPAKVLPADMLPVSSVAPVIDLKPAGPVYTVALVDGRMTVFRDGEPAPDSPWQIVMDQQQAEADRVMVRAVSPGYPGPNDDRDTWVLDPEATGHRAPFAHGNLVVRSSGREGIHRLVDLTVDRDAPRHRSLRITVEPTDVVVDPDAF